MTSPTTHLHIKLNSSPFALQGLLAKASLVVAALLLIGVYFINAALDERLLMAAQRSERQVVLLMKSGFESTADLIDNELLRFSRNYDPTLPELEQRQLLSQLKLPESIAQIALAREDGIVTASNLAYPVPTSSIADRPHFRVFANGGENRLYVSAPVLGRVSNLYTLQFVRPLSHRDGSFAGIIVASYLISDFNKFLRTINPGDGGIITILGKDGLVRLDNRGDDYVGIDNSKSAEFQKMTSLKEGGLRSNTSPENGGHIGYFSSSEDLQLHFVSLAEIDKILLTGLNFRLALWIAGGSASSMVLIIAIMINSTIKKREFEQAQAHIADTEQQRSEILKALKSVPNLILALAETERDGEGSVLKIGHVFEPSTSTLDDKSQAETNSSIQEKQRVYFERLNMLTSSSLFVERATAHHSFLDRFTVNGTDWEISWTFVRLFNNTERFSTPRSTGETLQKNADVLIFGFDNSLTRRNDAAMQQLAKLATLGEVATGLAHELNQPLNVIRLAAENAIGVVETSGNLPYALDKLNKIVLQTERAGRVIDHMRTFGRRQESSGTQIDPWLSIDGSLNIIAEQLRLAGIRLIVNAQPGVNSVRCNQDQLEQVLLNLLSNARDAIIKKAETEGPDWPRAIEINLNPTPDGGTQLSVTDTGGGIPDYAMAKIFEPFFTTKPAGKGTGLGLSLSRSIIRTNGGELKVTNVNKGARFDVNLPHVDAYLSAKSGTDHDRAVPRQRP